MRRELISLFAVLGSTDAAVAFVETVRSQCVSKWRLANFVLAYNNAASIDQRAPTKFVDRGIRYSPKSRKALIAWFFKAMSEIHWRVTILKIAVIWWVIRG